MAGETPEIVNSLKRISGSPSWEADDAYLQLVASLEWKNGVTIEGALLRAKVRPELRDQCVMLQLEYPQTDRTDSAVYRIDWKPLGSHKNDMRGPLPELRGTIISGSHVHAFEYNWLSDQQRLLCYNLPIAAPMKPEPASYEGLLKVAGETFNVQNMSLQTLPYPWSERKPDLFDESV